MASGLASAAPGDSPWLPSGVFVQAGADEGPVAATVGALWDTSLGWSLGPGRLGLYTEASIAGWRYRRADGNGRTALAQLELTPTLRYRFADGASPFFVEAGVGVTFTSKRFETPRKTFSTNFNFGDHVGVGYDFGPRQAHEVALRFEHYSNAGISEPNPGLNFVQLRYAYRFR